MRTLYNRNNRMLYAAVGAGLEIGLPRSFAFSPKITYTRLFNGAQRSYTDTVVRNRQRSGSGIEVVLPVSKRLSAHSRIGVVLFYRSRKIADSDATEAPAADGTRVYVEPKNRTHETGLKLEYQF